MPEGGTLKLATSTVGETVVISIADTGVGMYPEVKSRVFDPFFTTKGTAGLGLGLAVSFGIIRRHGGNIDVESNMETVQSSVSHCHWLASLPRHNR